MTKFVSICIFFLLFGCRQHTLLDQTKQFDGHNWNRFDFVEMEFEITNITALYDLQLMLVNHKHYPFDYISLNVTLYFPDETMRSRDIEIRLQDKNLVWLGAVNKEWVTTRYSYIKSLKFAKPGKVRIRIENKMSRLNLEGVRSLGVLVTKAN